MSEEGKGASERELSLDTLFDILSHRRRRVAIACLHTHDTTLTLADLAEEVAVRERNVPFQDIPADDIKQIYMSLYHSHVQKLADHDVVAYDQDRDLVTLTVSNRDLLSVLGVAPDVSLR